MGNSTLESSLINTTVYTLQNILTPSKVRCWIMWPQYKKKHNSFVYPQKTMVDRCAFPFIHSYAIITITLYSSHGFKFLILSLTQLLGCQSDIIQSVSE